MTDESAIIAFYRGRQADAAGRSIEDIWAFDHRRLEMVHDYIQWLFPLPDASRFNAAAPRLTPADAQIFRGDAELRKRVLISLDVMLDFFRLSRSNSEITRSPNFALAHWLEPLNHNHLRLTRILLFLRHAGLEAEAKGLAACLEDIASHEASDALSPRTLTFWREAMSAVL